MNIQQNVLRIQHRIEAACQQAGRASNAVRLLAVSKTKSVAEISTAFEAGQSAFGENYVQEGVDKRFNFANNIKLNWNGILSARYNPTKPVWSRNISIGCKP